MVQAVSPAYTHRDKQVASRAPLEIGGRVFKWSDVAAPDLPVPDAVRTGARDFLTAANLDGASELGFVVLHRCGPEDRKSVV